MGLDQIRLAFTTYQVGFRPIETFKQDFYDKPHIYTFFITSAIRVVFNRPPITDDPATSYYVVADLDIHYQCACFGHGSSCGGEVSCGMESALRSIFLFYL